jgi:tellurite resistance protein TerC
VHVTAAGWALTIGVIIALLALDLILASVRPHAVGYREAAAWSVFHIAAAVIFGVVFAGQVGWGFGVQYFAGYIVERSLSVDNLFVFVIIMATFAVPREHQQRALTFGIIAALALRSIFIALGATLLSLLSFMFLIFGLILLWTAVRLYRHRDEDPDIQDNALVRSVRRILPVSDTYAGGRLISRVDGRRVVTPLFIVFITIGGTDLVFALDSIPAVFGITDQGYIVFVANAFALLGLRPLFFLVSGLLDRLVYLSSGLALILAFIGVKLILHWAHELDGRVPEISTAWSLGVIAIVLAVTTAASVIKSRRQPTARAHAGAVLGVPPAAGADESPRSGRADRDRARRRPLLHDPAWAWPVRHRGSDP